MTSEGHVEDMFRFAKPQYMQTADKKSAFYFGINSVEPILYSSEEQPTLEQIILSDGGKKYIEDLCYNFVKTCSKFFPKPLTYERVATRLRHIIKVIQNDDECETGIVAWHMVPISMCVSGTQIEVYWKLTKTYTLIAFEDEGDGVVAKEEAIQPEPVISPMVQLVVNDETISNEVQATTISSDELVAVEDITYSANTTDLELTSGTLVLKDTTAHKDKIAKKLREARLQVQLAKFRAARAYEKYVAKYGDDLSDTDGGETTDYTTDGGSDGSGSSSE